MPFITPISTDSPSSDIEPLYQGAMQRAGYVAQIIQIMSNDARTAMSSMEFYISIMKHKNGLSGAQKEMLATVVSNANHCFY